MTELAEAPQAVKTIDHWIAGKRREGASGRSGPVFDPATGVQTSSVGFASPEEIDLAVQTAKRAFPEWRALSIGRRAELFFKIRELFHAHREDLARLLTAEHGKVLSDALGEVARGLEVIEFCCGLPTLLKGGYSEQASTGIDVYSLRQPLGVVAGITPFNFPAMVPMWMWAPALACGNTFVLKPSEKDPSASLLTAELLKQAGVPDGVFNVVQGDKVAVDAILGHPDIAAVSFVGSTPIARYVYETATANGKRCQALGGAKNHMIVLPDADIDMAADAAVSAGYGSAGERCMAVSMVVAVGGVADDLVQAIKARIPAVKVAPGLEPGAEMGPLVTREHRDRVASYVERAPGEGATVVVDGREAVPNADGFFLGPCLIDNVKPGMDNYADEIFGPVLGVTRVDTYEEAVRLVNENPYGNGTAIFTRDGGVARQFEFDVQAGMVGINVPIPVPVAYYSFGGWKASLFGDRHIYGPEGIDFYTRTKVVTSRWPDPATSKVDLGFPKLDNTQTLIRLLFTALVAAVICGAASAAAPPPWRTVTFARHSGPVSAVMTVQRQAHGDGFFTFRKLHLVVRVRGKTVLDRQLCDEARCGPGSHHSLVLQNVWGGSLPEAVIGIYTGGAHCCFDTVVAFTDTPLAGRFVEHDFGDPGYDGERHDGVYEFMTADDRFAYAFTSFAASGLPAQVLMLSPAGKFVDITSTRLDLVRKDASFYWRAYTSDRGKPDGDIRGVLAAWCADEYRLGEGAACRAELARAVRHGWVGKTGDDIWPAGAKFVSALDRSLRKWGYRS